MHEIWASPERLLTRIHVASRPGLCNALAADRGDVLMPIATPTSVPVPNQANTARVNATDTVFYNAFPGTSAATPHVAGVVGWIYSLPCSKIADDAKTDPVACVRRVRDLLLSNAEPNPSLKDITSTGGSSPVQRRKAWAAW